VNAVDRALNRILLVVVGLVLAAGCGWAIVVEWRPAWAADALRWWDASAAPPLSELASASIAVPGAGVLPSWVLAAGGAALLAIVLLVVVAARNRRGRSSVALVRPGARGSTSVDQAVVGAVLADPLARRADVLAARARVVRVRRRPGVELSVSVRRGADPAEAVAGARDAIREWDRLTGERTPVLLRLRDRSLLERLRASARVR